MTWMYIMYSLKMHFIKEWQKCLFHNSGNFLNFWLNERQILISVWTPVFMRLHIMGEQHLYILGGIELKKANYISLLLCITVTLICTGPLEDLLWAPQGLMELLEDHKSSMSSGVSFLNGRSMSPWVSATSSFIVHELGKSNNHIFYIWYHLAKLSLTQVAIWFMHSFNPCVNNSHL